MSQLESAQEGAHTSPILQQPLYQQIEAELTDRSIDVPLLPNVAAEVLSSSLDDTANAARLAELIQQDQGLASHMLRVVNSAAFRGSTEIVALQQAIARLGMERIREIALTVSLKGSLFSTDTYKDLLDGAWQHGLRTGLWAKEVSRSVRKNVEVAYLCGLLHNVGSPLIINRVAQLDDGLEDGQVLALVDALGQQAGLILVDEWALPASVGLAIRFQGQLADAKNAQDLVAIIDTARYLSHQLGAITDPEEATNALPIESVVQLPAVQHLNFYPDDVQALYEHVEHIEEVVRGMS